MPDQRLQFQRRAAVWCLCLTPLMGLTSARGQAQQTRQEPDAFINQQRALEERMRVLLKEEAGQGKGSLLDWGGWYNLHLFVFDDGVESSRTFRRHDLRLWGRVVLEEGAHEFYARGRWSLLDFNSGDSFDGNEDDVEGPNLERGYYRISLAKALAAHTGRSIDYDVVLTVGRDLTVFGSGLSLATPLDHVSLKGTSGGFELTGLAGRTVPSTLDFDLSRTARRTRRRFMGVEAKYHKLQRHEPFVYALWQRDHNREAVFRLLQKFDYDSLHVGLGSTGELVKGLRYIAEGVYETGHSFSNRRFLRASRIEAWALLGGLEYLYPGPRKARASIEYLFASGDGQRITSPTNTLGAHRGGFKDGSFIGFGYHDTGLSFAPRYSNLHMWRVGGSLYPWPEHTTFRRLEVGTDWYLFFKHHRSGAVSDPTARVESAFLGWEMDCFANWRVTSELSCTARFGGFFPGRSFGDRTTRTFLLLGLTWRF